jgi:HK97 family phage portal protein
MRPLNAVRRLATKALASVGIRFSGYGGQSVGGSNTGNYPYWRFLLPGARYDYEAEAGDVWRNGCVAVCLSWINRNFPEPRPVVRRRDGLRQEIEGHALIRLLDKPNTFYNCDTLWAGTIVSWFVDGNAYWIKQKAGWGKHARTTGFFYVPHWQMFPRWPSDGSKFISHYEYIVDGVKTPLDPEDVVHFRCGIDPHRPRYGMSDLKAQLREVCSDNEAATFSAATLRNMGIPGLVLSPEDPNVEIVDDDRRDIKAKWREEFTGDNRGGLMVMSVKMAVAKVAMTPEELVLDKIRNIPEARIHGAIGLNAQVTGQNVGNQTRTYTNYGEARRAAYYDCIVPLQKQLGKQFSDQCPELVQPNEILAWDYSDVHAMEENADSRAKRGAVLFQAGLTNRDESRREAGLPPVTDGTGDKYHEGAEMRGSLPMMAGNTMGRDS